MVKKVSILISEAHFCVCFALFTLRISAKLASTEHLTGCLEQTDSPQAGLVPVYLFCIFMSTIIIPFHLFRYMYY